MSVTPPPDRAPREPWFRRRPGLVLAVAAVLYVAVLAGRLQWGTPADAESMLFAFPVALVATAFGFRAGLLAGVVAVGLIVVWVVGDDVSLTAMGWFSRVAPLLLLGGLLGQATDQVRRAEQERRRLEAAALLHREAIEINDSLVQGMVAAKWSLEGGDLDTGRRTLEETIVRARELVSRLIHRADMGGRSEVLRTEGPDA